MNTTSYLENLKRFAEERHAERARSRPVPPRLLVDRVREWHAGQPNERRNKPWTMAELVAELGAAPHELGPVLHKLGWKRKRSWRPGFPFGRYWQPPVDTD